MVPFNLVVRLLLEVVAIASLGYWGYTTASAAPAKVVLAVAAPVVLIVVWAYVVAPGADNPLSPTTRIVIGSALLLLSAVALAKTGLTRAASGVALAIVLNTILMLVFPHNDGA